MDDDQNRTNNNIKTIESPGFNRAPLEVQLQIGKDSGYGETLITIMKGLETDLITDNIWLGTMGDAAYIPFRE